MGNCEKLLDNLPLADLTCIGYPSKGTKSHSIDPNMHNACTIQRTYDPGEELEEICFVISSATFCRICGAGAAGEVLPKLVVVEPSGIKGNHWGKTGDDRSSSRNIENAPTVVRGSSQEWVRNGHVQSLRRDPVRGTAVVSRTATTIRFLDVVINLVELRQEPFPQDRYTANSRVRGEVQDRTAHRVAIAWYHLSQCTCHVTTSPVSSLPINVPGVTEAKTNSVYYSTGEPSATLTPEHVPRGDVLFLQHNTDFLMSPSTFRVVEACRDFEEHNPSYQQWKSLIHAPGLPSIRKLAKFIDPPTPHDWLVLARINAVGQWLRSSVRRDQVMRVEEVALAGNFCKDGDNASRASPEGGAVKHGTSFTTAASSVGMKGGEGTQNSGSNHSQWYSETTRREHHDRIWKHIGDWGASSKKPLLWALEVAIQVAVDSIFSSFTANRRLSQSRDSWKSKQPGGKASLLVSRNPLRAPTKLRHKARTRWLRPGQSRYNPPLFGTSLRPVKVDSPDSELAIRKATVPRASPANCKAPVE
ncbi:hypothetical protein EDB89DRAFT_1904216 [Lactarius sanguifluus]|nr:hypothetical protein EDB89DRAFT_1904216 [Lactarius sanguifluus]